VELLGNRLHESTPGRPLTATTASLPFSRPSRTGGPDHIISVDAAGLTPEACSCAAGQRGVVCWAVLDVAASPALRDLAIARWEAAREHITGHGSPLIAAAVAAGCQVRVVLDVPGDRGLERRWHNAHGTRVCPECRPRRRRSAGRQLRLFSSTGAAHAAAPTPRRLPRAA